MRISVIIPTLNESARIGSRLEELRALAADEVVVVDGGSTDGTPDRVREFPAVNLIDAGPGRRGRARQMNLGARESTGEILLFLHADCRLPADAFSRVRAALRDPAVVGGAFRIRTVCDAGASRLTPLLFLADLRSRYTMVPYGDQAIFVRRQTFDAMDGFPDQPLMEDLEFSRRMKAWGRVQTVPATVEVSGRRFLARPLAFTIAVNVFPLLYRLGVSPQRLARWYGDVR